MARSGYGRVGGNRRSGGAWQWVVIGAVLGLGCSAVLVLSLLTFGVLEIGSDAETEAVALDTTPLPTPDVQATVNMIVASTLAAAPPTQVPQPTQEPQIIVPSPTSPVTEAPTLEPTVEASPQVAEPTQEEVGGLELPTQQGASEPQTVGDVPAELAAVISETVPIPAGTFLMGTTPNEVANAVVECTQRDGGNCIAEYGQDSYPQHSVTLDAYEMEVTEVTNQQYVAFLNWMGPNSHVNGCDGRPCVDVNPPETNSVIIFDSLNYDVATPNLNNLPVVGVTWFGAKAYCEAIGRRLPTEAEWEYAAKGDEGVVYPWGNEWNVEFARTNRPLGENIGVTDVGSYPQNISPFGVRDMAGNAAEWVADWYGANHYAQQQGGVVNPQGPSSGVDRVVRGGHWDVPPFFARTVHRQHFPPLETYLYLGFRCAEDFEEPQAAAPADAGSLGSLQDVATAEPEPTEGEVNAAPTQRPLELPPTATLDSDAAPPQPPGEG